MKLTMIKLGLWLIFTILKFQRFFIESKLISKYINNTMYTKKIFLRNLNISLDDNNVRYFLIFCYNKNQKKYFINIILG